MKKKLVLLLVVMTVFAMSLGFSFANDDFVDVDVTDDGQVHVDVADGGVTVDVDDDNVDVVVDDVVVVDVDDHDVNVNVGDGGVVVDVQDGQVDVQVDKDQVISLIDRILLKLKAFFGN